MASWNSFSFILRGLGIVLLVAATAAAQESAQPSVIDQQQQAAQQTEQQAEQQKAQAAREKQALKLLDQTVAEAQALRLPENHIRVQFVAADTLWTHDEARARSLLTEAQGALAAMIGGLTSNDQQQLNTAAQVRREMLTVVAGRDPALALDILRATRLPQVAQQPNNLFRRIDPDANLEFSLLALVAANDPKQALQKAEEMLSKGEYSGALANLLSQLQAKDKEAAAKLTDDVLKSLHAENLTTNQNARSLAFMLLRSGPQTSAPVDQKVSATVNNQVNAQANNQPSGQVLGEAAYRDLLDTLISAALSVTPQSATPNPRGGGRGGFGPRGGGFGGQDMNGMMLLAGLSSLLPQIDKYLPARSALVRQKLSTAGINMEQQANFRDQMSTLTQQGSVDSLISAAAQVPPGMQNRLYQQAAMKAVDEGNTARARQIANEHLSADARDQVLQAIERQQIIRAAQQGKMDEARQLLGRLQSDDARVDALMQLVTLLLQSGDKKPAQQLLDEARGIVSRHAENYQQLEAQLRVAQAYADIEPARSFEVLEPGISQINELLGAAALLNGFEGNFFKEGELPLRGDSSLGGIIAEYAQALATLARVDFDDAQTTADKFQRLEPRIVAKLAIARSVLGGTAADANITPNTFNRRGLGFRRVN